MAAATDDLAGQQRRAALRAVDALALPVCSGGASEQGGLIKTLIKLLTNGESTTIDYSVP